MTNTATGLAYGNDPFKSLKSAIGRGAGAGAVSSGLDYIFNNPGMDPSDRASRPGSGITSPGSSRDPRSSCGSSHSGGGASRTSQSGVPQNGNGNGFDYLGFAKALIQGAAIGGVSNAAFYGGGKAVEKLVESIHRTPKVYMTGKEGEAEFARMFGGESQAYFKTSRGKRFVDQYAKGVAHESKVGYTSLNQRIKTQILKDAELINTGQITGAHWHFFTSGVTGKGGASQPLLDFLVNNGIKYTIY